MSDIPKAGAYVVAKLRTLDAALEEAAPRVLGGARGAAGEEIDPEGVHDLRVAIRRMRTLLKMARDLFGRWHTGVVREAFAEVMRATGELRDEEVLEDTLSGAANGSEYGAWLEQRRTREVKLRQSVVRRIERGDLERARLLLKALIVFPVDPDKNIDLSKFARRTVERARRNVERQRDAEVTDVVGMHDLRIAYKELRYSIELLADALPIDARAQLEPATVFQKRLGELHDVDVATEVVRAAKGLSDAARDEALATLATMRSKRVGKYLREVDPLGAGRPRGDGRPKGRADANANANADADADVKTNGNAPSGTSGSVEDAPTVYLRRAATDLLPATALAAPPAVPSGPSEVEEKEEPAPGT